ncbi:MAG: N-formylglutamate deformylase [Burkholderiaceae bacterium]
MSTPDAPPVFTLRRGQSPLMVSMPHVGIHVPPDIAARLSPAARTLADTDWHLPLVYDFLGALDATVLVATHSRLVIDLNRPPDNRNLYPGQDTTGLVPLDTFRKEPAYLGAIPDEAEIDARRQHYWQPYHDTLAGELARLRGLHPRVVLWDAHSIASELPRFFQGRLTDLNFGTAGGASCDEGLIDAILAPVRPQHDYTWVLNGRFTGGYITRSHGRPADGVHAVQLEMSQIIYMNETEPFALREDLCRRLRPLLSQCLANARDWALQARV